MSAVTSSESTSKSASKKKKSRKSKSKANGKLEVPSTEEQFSGLGTVDDGQEEDDEESASPDHLQREDSLHMPSSPPDVFAHDRGSGMQNGASQPSAPEPDNEEDEDEDQDGETATEDEQPVNNPLPSTDASARLDAMQAERDNLRAEVTQLRQSLESLQERHSGELSAAKEELEQSHQSKEHAEQQYRNLMGKVSTIRSQLGERLKEDAAALSEARGQISELETERDGAKEKNERLQESISELNTRLEEQASEVDELRSRTTLSTSNWAKERDDLVSRSAYLQEEYEIAKQAMQDWEILATDERTRREGAEERAQELETQLEESQVVHERIRSEAEMQGSTVDGLQRALREVQEERKRELRALVERNESQLSELEQRSKGAEDAAAELRKQLEDARMEVERCLPFEKEVKEKNLLLGKARHEAVILNEHLTKALRFMKRGKPEDNVDRHLVTNYLLQFLALDRSDAKKFQILQLIAALLGWSEEQKEAAGLLRAGNAGASSWASIGSGTQSLRLPMSPFRRTPSTPSLSTDFVADSPASATRESLAELWSEFLEREAEQGGGGTSRKGSMSVRSASITSPTGSLFSPLPSGGRPSDARRKESVSSSSTVTTGK